MNEQDLTTMYGLAKARYAEVGVDTDAALAALAGVPVSLHCWQGDDIAGFEGDSGDVGGGLAVTGNYPGKARTADELRADLDKAYSLIPGTHRLSLHAIYAETGGVAVSIATSSQPEHFAGWIDWAKANDLRPRLQPDLLRASDRRRRLHAVEPRRGHPQVLDRALHRLPQDRRGDGPGARHARRDQHLDPRRLQGPSGRPRDAAGPPARCA